MNYRDLSAFQRELQSVLRLHTASLESFYAEKQGRFVERVSAPAFPDNSVLEAKSTALCVMSLTDAGLWDEGPWYHQTAAIVGRLAQTGEMVGTEGDDGALLALAEFKVAIDALIGEVTQGAIPESVGQSGAEMERRLLEGLHETLGRYPEETDNGNYSYLVERLVAALRGSGELSSDLRKMVLRRTRQQIEHQLALDFGGAHSFDRLALAHAVVLMTKLAVRVEFSPDRRQLLRQAVESIFAAEGERTPWAADRLDGTAANGSALIAVRRLLGQASLVDHVHGHIGQLIDAAAHLKQIAYPLEDGGYGWSATPNPRRQGPHAGATAAVFSFLHAIDLALSEALRRSVFAYVGAAYGAAQRSGKPEFADHLLDSDIWIDGQRTSLLEILRLSFALPVKEAAERFPRRRALPRSVPTSAIFFGPPGTAKTSLAVVISKYLGWPLMMIDPSHLVRNGLQNVQAETSKLFDMLADLEQVVVLLDEMDEMVRERSSEDSELFSRFLTTLLLPKLAVMSKRRRSLFIMATNHIDRFDAAIRRPGRFDLIVQVMPPSLNAKLESDRWPHMPEIFARHGLDVQRDLALRKQLDELTFAEYDDLARRMSDSENGLHLLATIRFVHARGTLQQPVSRETGETWAEVCVAQRSMIRIPTFSRR